VLVLVNVLSINVTALAVLWYRGYRPDHWFKKDTARRATRKRVGALVAAILVLSLFLGVVTYDSYRTATFEQEVRGDVEGLLDQPEYEQLSLQEVRFEYDDPVPPREPTAVTVVVGQPPDAESATLAAPVDRRIDDALGTLDVPGPIVDPGPVDVQVRYVEIESA